MEKYNLIHKIIDSRPKNQKFSIMAKNRGIIAVLGIVDTHKIVNPACLKIIDQSTI